MSRLREFLSITSLLFVASSAAAFGLYFGMQVLLRKSPIIIAVSFARVAQYQNQYPIPYLLAIAFVFAVISALWLVLVAPRFLRFRSLQIVAIPFIAVQLAGPIWGMLWVYHDMQAGFFPGFAAMVEYLLNGAQTGIFFAFNAALLSFPFSLLAYSVACTLLVISIKRFVSSQSDVVGTG